METAISTDKDPATGLFVPGNNARGHKRDRVQRLMQDIAGEFEGGLAAMRSSDLVVLSWRSWPNHPLFGVPVLTVFVLARL
jgi:hypothetical protein